MSLIFSSRTSFDWSDNYCFLFFAFLFDPNRYQFNQMEAEANKHDSELHNTKGQIAELKRMITRLQRETDAAKTQVSLRFPIHSFIN